MSSLPTTPDEHRRWWAEQTDVPYGYCWCGCGEQTAIAKGSAFKRFQVDKCPRRCIHGHNITKRLGGHFSKKYEVDTNTGCWIWKGHKDKDGYCATTINGRSIRAHRASYIFHNGSIPTGLQLDHLCRTPSCVNPEHLEPTTNAVNSQRGSNTKLTPNDVLEIRRLVAEGLQSRKEIGARFGVTYATVTFIHLRKTWKNL